MLLFFPRYTKLMSTNVLGKLCQYKNVWSTAGLGNFFAITACGLCTETSQGVRRKELGRFHIWFCILSNRMVQGPLYLANRWSRAHTLPASHSCTTIKASPPPIPDSALGYNHSVHKIQCCHLQSLFEQLP
jgi:hypothetical protein